MTDRQISQSTPPLFAVSRRGPQARVPGGEMKQIYPAQVRADSNVELKAREMTNYDTKR